MEFRAQADTLPTGARPLPGLYYTSDEVLAAEIEGVFRRHWLCVARAGALAGPGSFVTAAVGPERVLVVRRPDGRLAGFDNVCRHRGHLLCTEASGQVGDLIRCPFHAWTYDLDGALVSAPFMHEVPGFDTGTVALPRVGIAEWEGFVFVHLGDAPGAFAADWSAVLSHFARWGLPEMEIVDERDYVIEANWKLVVENYSECYHCPSIHPRFSDRCAYRSGRNDHYRGPFLGGFMDLRAGYPTLSMSGGPCAVPRPGLTPEDLRRVYFYALFPNLLLSLHPDYAVAYTLWPLAPGRTLARCSWLFAGGDGDVAGAVEFWDEANREDFDALAYVQQGVATRRHAPAPYSRLESLAAAFDDHLLDVLERAHAPTFSSGT